MERNKRRAIKYGTIFGLVFIFVAYALFSTSFLMGNVKNTKFISSYKRAENFFDEDPDICELSGFPCTPFFSELKSKIKFPSI